MPTAQLAGAGKSARPSVNMFLMGKDVLLVVDHTFTHGAHNIIFTHDMYGSLSFYTSCYIFRDSSDLLGKK